MSQRHCKKEQVLLVKRAVVLFHKPLSTGRYAEWCLPREMRSNFCKAKIISRGEGALAPSFRSQPPTRLWRRYLFRFKSNLIFFFAINTFEITTLIL